MCACLPACACVHALCLCTGIRVRLSVCTVRPSVGVYVGAVSGLTNMPLSTFSYLSERLPTTECVPCSHMWDLTVAAYMVRRLMGSDASEQAVGQLTGILAAAGFFSRFLVAYAWGMASDRLGRKACTP
jgi:hypothetical protein